MAGIKEEKKIYLVGIYCRLSKDDGTDNESASIATQKSILTDYVKKQGWHIAKTYVDDGYSGTNFQRPSFQNMIKDIESGLINCVITKDLSRLGRNYLDCGLYLEVFFPEHNVRYIAVNDGVDTLNKSAMDITPFRNILNEMYAADISVKIKSAYRARFQQGKFMGTTAPYGYIKDPADHNHLLIDDKVAHVVKEIFDLALKGNGVAKICRHLNKQHILRPAAYAAERGETGFERHFEGNEDKRYIWSGNSVRSILRSPIYAGNLVGYKRIAANMKSKKRPSKLPEEWEVIPNTHEGIVTQEEFDIVQQLITSRRLPQNKGGILAFALNIKRWEKFRENKFCKLLAVILTLSMCVTGIGEAGIGKDAADIPDKRIDYIKEQKIFPDGDTTYGDGLDAYCSDEHWQAFVATDGSQIVQFEGNATYKGQQVTVTVQFQIEGDCEGYQPGYVGLNDVGQNSESATEFMLTVCGRSINELKYGR